MSGYGPPPGAPHQGGPGSPPPGAPSAGGYPAQSGSGASALSPDMIAYAAGALGVLSFIWGFLDWYSITESGFGSTRSTGIAGYAILSTASGAIGLSIVAGVFAALRAFEHKKASSLPVAFALAALLLTFGSMVDKGPFGGGLDASGADIGVGIGMILVLITAVLQTAALGYIWLVAVGKLSAPQPRAAAPAYGTPPGVGGQYGGSYGPPPGYPPQQPRPAQAPVSPPPGGQAPGSQTPGSPPTGYGPPPGYAPPQSYGAPTSTHPGQPGSGQPGGGQPGGQSAPGTYGSSGSQPPAGGAHSAREPETPLSTDETTQWRPPTYGQGPGQ